MPVPALARASTASFGPYRLDLTARQLLHRGAPVALRRKAWTVLRCLVERTGAVVSTEEILDAAWHGTTVSPQTVTNVIAELRAALDDRAGAPRWIRTVYGAGYRFIGRVRRGAPAPTRPARCRVRTTTRARAGQRPALIGRAAERAALRSAYTDACAGRRRVLFVSGDPGIGKTTLVEAFLDTLAGPRRATVVRGQCLDQHGPREPYMPLLTAIGDLARATAGRRVRAALRRYAPTWLVQVPWLLDPRERPALERSVQGTTATRMLREGSGLCEALARDSPLVLVVEDLHWTDLATLDLVVSLAQHAAPARLLVLATYRQADALAGDASVGRAVRSLCRRGYATELRLAPFDLPAVRAYLRTRLDETLARKLAARVAECSAGNPLFLRAVVEQIVQHPRPTPGRGGGRTLRIELPEDMREYVATELARLPADSRALLEAASVVGVLFSAHELATGVPMRAEEVERRLEELARRGSLVRRVGRQAAEGTGARFGFVHAVYRRIVQDSLPPLRARTLHRDIAGGLEAAHAAGLHGVAGRLAVHYGEGRSPRKELDYLELAAANAARRFAYREAAAYMRSALERVRREPETRARREREAGQLVKLGGVLVLARGYSDPELEDIFTRASTSYTRLGSAVGRFIAGTGLAIYFLTSARFEQAERHTDRLWAMSRRALPGLRPLAACYAAYVSSAKGDLVQARRRLEGVARDEPDPNVPPDFDVRRMIASQLALVLTELGLLDEARTHAEAALARSRRDGRPAELAHAALFATEAALLRRDLDAARSAASAAVAVSEENGFASFAALARFYHARATYDAAPAAAVATMEDALAERRRLRDRWHESMLLGLLADAKLPHGDVAGAVAHVREARRFVARTGERHYEPEIHRVAGDCRLAAGGRAAALRAEASFRRAYEIARARGARLWGLRAAVSWARLLAERSQRVEARRLLEAATDGLDHARGHADMRDARALLARI